MEPRVKLTMSGGPGEHFQTVQREFAAHMRDPANVAPPGKIEDRRLQIYRDLIYNNIEGFLSSGFPIIRSLYSDERWHQIVRDFICRHQSQSPYFLQISEEFLGYIESEFQPLASDPPFLLELARYEWCELALYVDEHELPLVDKNAPHRLLESIVYLSPLAWRQLYTFPVHKIGPGFQPQQPDEQPTSLVVYRNRRDRVEFMETNLVTARLLELCDGNNDHTGEQLLAKIARELAHPQPETVIDGGRQTLTQLFELDILLCRAPASPTA